MAKKGLGGVISGSIVLFLGAIIVTAGVSARFGVNTFLIEPMVDDSFQGIEDMALAELTPAIDTMAYTLVLPGILDQMQYAFGGDPEILAMFINTSTSMQLIGQMMGDLAPAYGGDPNAALIGIFNDNIQATYATPVMGTAESVGGAVGYTPYEVFNVSTGSPLGLPGILEEDPLGDMTPGMLAFLQVYSDPTGAGFADVAQLATVGYNLPSQTHLDVIAGWITYHLFPIVATLISMQLEWTVPDATADTVDDYILAQWAEKVLFPDGLGVLDPLATNFEVCTNFTSLTQVQNVWASVTDQVGINRWFAHDPSLASELSLNSTQFAAVDAWVGTVKPTLFGGIAYNFGFSNDNHYMRLLLGQWIVPGFLPGYEEGLIPAVPFEINMTDPLDSDSAIAVWEDLKSQEGIIQWYKAALVRGGSEYTAKKNEHGLTDSQMCEICNYLEVFRDDAISTLNEMQPEADQISLPIWGTNIGKALDDIGLYLPIGGAVLTAAGIVLVVLFSRKRR